MYLLCVFAVFDVYEKFIDIAHYRLCTYRILPVVMTDDPVWQLLLYSIATNWGISLQCKCSQTLTEGRSSNCLAPAKKKQYYENLSTYSFMFHNISNNNYHDNVDFLWNTKHNYNHFLQLCRTRIFRSHWMIGYDNTEWLFRMQPYEVIPINGRKRKLLIAKIFPKVSEKPWK